MKLRVASLSLVLLLSSCAGEPFRPGKPVEITGNAFTREYVQDGQNISRYSLLEHLRSDEATRGKAESSQALGIFATVPAGVGGGMIGYGLGRSSASNQGTMIGVGAGLVALGLGLAILAEDRFQESIDIYNARLRAASKSGIKPMLVIPGTDPRYAIGASSVFHFQ